MSVEFLSLAEVLEIHQDQIARYGGALGTRDLDVLESALAMPMAAFRGVFMHTDVFEMAAAYLFHLVQSHPFVPVTEANAATQRKLHTVLIEVKKEVGGRWIAEAPELPGVLAYGATQDEAICKAKVLALRVMADRLEHGEELPEGGFAFDIAS